MLTGNTPKQTEEEEKSKEIDTKERKTKGMSSAYVILNYHEAMKQGDGHKGIKSAHDPVLLNQIGSQGVKLGIPEILLSHRELRPS